MVKYGISVLIPAKHNASFLVVDNVLMLCWNGLISSSIWAVFIRGLCRVDIRECVCKYYGCCNNILSVLGRGKNEITTLNLVRFYCVLVLTYTCEIWNLTSSEYRTVNVLWNNILRRLLIVAGEKVTWACSSTVVVLMSYIVDQQAILLLARLMGQYCFARWLSVVYQHRLSSSVTLPEGGPGAWSVGRPTLHGGPVLLRPVRRHLIVI